MTQERSLSALMVELCLPERTSVIVWPDHEPDKPCCKSDKPWIDLQPGDRVQLKQKGEKRDWWASVVVKRVILYRCHPVEFNDRAVNCGRDWLEGRDDGGPVV
jgi:hypothetical protein